MSLSLSSKPTTRKSAEEADIGRPIDNGANVDSTSCYTANCLKDEYCASLPVGTQGEHVLGPHLDEELPLLLQLVELIGTTRSKSKLQSPLAMYSVSEH